MLDPGDYVGVAVSGGADSVCLLHVLLELAGEFGLTLRVLHLNHGWRGADSDADADFVADVATRLGLPCLVERALPGSESNLEQAGRNARLDFFARAREAYGLACIATGHTRSDQAETVLYRLLRGSGTAGLSGIRPVTGDGRIRPLLDCSRDDVLGFLLKHNLTWREDATNADASFHRNRIRHQLLPLLRRDYQPAVADVLAATAELARDEEAWWAEQVETVLPQVIEKRNPHGIVILADKLSSQHPALSRRVIRRLLSEVRGDLRGLDLVHVDRVRQLAAQKEGHGRIQIPGVDVFRSFEWLRLGPLRTESRFALDYAYPIERKESSTPRTVPVGAAGIAICLQIQPEHVSVAYKPYNEEAVELDATKLSDPVELRNWHPGDTIQLPGREPVKLKQLFQEFRIPLWDRHLWPVLTSAGAVVWSRRFGPSAGVQRTPDTRLVLHLAIQETDVGETA